MQKSKIYDDYRDYNPSTPSTIQIRQMSSDKWVSVLGGPKKYYKPPTKKDKAKEMFDKLMEDDELMQELNVLLRNKKLENLKNSRSTK